MSGDPIPDELREFLFGRVEPEEHDHARYLAPCYNMTWDKKKLCWTVKCDGKRVLDLTAEDFSEDIDIRSYDFVDHILSILRAGGPEGLKLHIEELRCVK